MGNLPPQTPNSGYLVPDKDAEHLKTLSICWYIVAGLQCLGLCGGLAYIALGIMAMVGGGGGDNKAAGGIFACAGAFFLIISAVMAFLSYKVGKSLVARTGKTLCFVMAILMCLSIPLGTILGIFTIMVLSRPSVKDSFR